MANLTKNMTSHLIKQYKKGDIKASRTLQLYKSEARKYCEYLRNEGVKTRSIKESRYFVEDYIRDLQNKGYSPSTVRTAASALAKVYSCKSTDFDVEYEKRVTSQFTKSRKPAMRDMFFDAEKNKDLIRFQSMCGLRRNELAHLKAEDLVEKNGKLYLELDGRYCKHGLARTVEIVAETRDDVEFFKNHISKYDGNQRIHGAFDAHHYRSVYAERLYSLKSRDIATLDRHEKYVCRGCNFGKVYDKEALYEVSKSLGHRRHDVVVNYYFYPK